MTSRLEVIRLQGLVNLGGELELTQYCDVFAGVTQSDVSLGAGREGGRNHYCRSLSHLMSVTLFGYSFIGQSRRRNHLAC